PPTTTGRLYAIKLNAGRDGNGAPLRGWIVFSEVGVLLGFVDEGLEGDGALRAFGDIVNLHTVPTTPGFLRACKREPYTPTA
ncbi:hypothetical protein, partial [Dactylosporangium siamense]